MADIVMPRLSDTMEEGTILRWLVPAGQPIARGQELVEIETDKATMTYESDQEGVLEILAAEGSTLEVGAVIARVGANVGADAARAARPAADARPASARASPASAQAATPGALSGEAAGGEHPGAAGRVRASPLARRIAGESGIDLRSLTGSGPGGRIVKADVLAPASGAAPRAGATPRAHARQAVGVPPPGTAERADAAPAAGAVQPTGAAQPADGGQAATVAGVATAKGRTTEVELSRTQQAIARRMAESKATIPDFTLQIDVDMEACVTLRTQLKQLSTPGAADAPGTDAPDINAHDVPTYNDMVVKAAALALREHPRANGSYRDGRVQLHSRVNVGVAVAAEGALVVPTVFDADEKSLGEIARETRTLAERVRSGTITPPELGGGTFTVSNLGMYGVRSFTAIINPPQAGILSVGALGPRPVAHEGAVVARNTMTLVLACDHRILYGAEAALCLARVRELLEAPASLTL